MADSIYPDRNGARNANFRGGSFHKCDQCGVKVWVGPVRALEHKRHFCDARCRDLWLSGFRGEQTSNYRGGEIDKTCIVCSKGFRIPRGEHTRGFGKFCSRKCFFANLRASGVEIPCGYCKKPFRITPHQIGVAKFCSRPCQYAGKRKIRTVREIAQRRLEVRIASLMGYSLKGRKAGCRWESLVGYTLADLMAHLESQFSPGMSWSNIGEWHIDHKRPRSAFKYDSPADPQFKACWRLKNLQPLWAADNMSKGARLNWRRAA